MARKLLDWKLKDETWRVGERTLLVGVVNVTPDSLFDQGLYLEPARAAERALELCELGADLIEIGAESFRAGSARVSEAEELRRLVPVLKLLRGKLPVPLIVETSKSAVAEKAVEYGAQVLKDPTGLLIDPEVARVANESGAALLLQHMRGTPDKWARQGGMKHAAALVHQELAAAISRALRYNVPRHSIVIDPGLGLGKRKEHNTDILLHLDRFTSFEIPVQISPTGKPFHTTPQVETAFHGAIAAAVAAILRGVHLLRTHDVPAMRAAALVADQLLREGRDMSGVHDTRTAEILPSAGEVRGPVTPPAAVTPPPPPEELPASKRPIAPRLPRSPRPAQGEVRPARDPRDTRYSPSESRPPRAPRDNRYSPENRPPRDSRDSRDARPGPGSRPPRDPRDTRYSPENRPPRDSRSGPGSRPPFGGRGAGPKDPRGPRGPRPPRGRR